MTSALAKRSFKLEQCLERVVDNRGKTPPLSESGIELLEVNAIIDGRKSPAFDNVRKYVSEKTYATWFRSGHPRRGDTLISTVGAIGRVAFVQDERGCIAQNVVSLRPKPSVLDGNFLYYYLASTETQNRLQSLNIGVAQPSLKVPHLLSLEIDLPDLPIQQRIADILSAYDELIENSQRRIKILEAMARGLYRQWFVHFRFPGHEELPRVASPLGNIPKGWQVVPFTDIADVLSGGTPKTDVAEYWSGAIPFFTPRDAPDCFYVQETDKHVTDLGLSKCASDLYPPDTVFITARGTVGKVALPSVPMAMNQSCYALRGKAGIPQQFLFLMTLQQVDYLKTNTGGATFDTIVVDTFRRMDVVKPTSELIASFARHVSAIFEQVNTLQRQIRNVRQTRDLLLPRLLSGQLLNIQADA